MSAPEQRKSNPVVFELGETLEISGVAALHSRLKQMLAASGAALTLDASRVERADAATLQTLLAFMRAAATENIPVQWHAPSAALHAAARNTGLALELGLQK